MPEGSKDENVKFFNTQDGMRGRDGGPYADSEDARIREVNRARAEGREPDLDNPPPFVGNQIVTSRFLEDNLYSNPSMVAVPGPLEAIEQSKVVKDAPYQITVGDLPVDTRTVLPDSERKSQQKAINELASDPANVATTGADSVSEDNQGEDTTVRNSPSGGANTASAQSGQAAGTRTAKTAAKKAASSKSAAARRTSGK